MNPPVPGNEKRRLEVLWEYEILDTPPEAEFDTLTQLAAQICQVPTAMISLVDRERQWFKARVGTNLTETAREVSFCTHAILKPELTVVPDATLDSRFAENPLVTGAPGIRFYAGMPLITSDGCALGTLCVVDYKPRELREDQGEALRLIAQVVLRRLNAHHHLREAGRTSQQTAQLARTTAELETEVHRRRRAEEETRRYADIVRNIHLGLLVWELPESEEPASLRLVAANPAASRATGLIVDSLIGKTIYEILPRLQGTDLAERYREVIRTGRTMDLGCVTYEDERIPRRDFSVRAFPLPHHCVGVAFDNITDRRLAEQAQIEAQARKSAILDSAPDAIVTIDHEGNVFEWNAAAEHIFGHRRATVLGKPLANLVFNESSAHKFQSALDLCVSTGESPLLGRRLELTGKRPDGTEFPTELSVARVPREGTPIYTGFLRDITERKRFEEALRASQSLYSSLVESLPQNVFRKDTQGRLTFANGRFCAMLGKRLEDLMGRTDEELFPSEIVEEFRRRDRLVLETGRTQEMTVELSLPDVGLRHLQVVRSPTYDSGGSLIGLQGMFWDITERVQLEAQLRQAQKMETVGQLAGGVAHDFNNLLTVILGHTEILRAAQSDGSKDFASLRQIATAAERAAHLTRQLLTFSRKQLLQPTLLEPNQLVLQLRDLLQRTVGESIELQLSAEGELPAVKVDPVMLEQVLLNLAVNSRDAMPNGGRLSVITDRVEVDQQLAGQHPDAKPGWHVLFKITDTGHGISPKHLPHIFEPFFTTKEVGKGTGLGLATVYGIVKQHGGWIQVSSELGRGTTFCIFLPTATPPDPQADLTQTSPATPTHGGNETILVVEDEAALRELVRSILEHAGYTILEAPSGRAALGVWREHRPRIDLLLTDVIMPDGVNGRQLALQLQADKPALKVLYTSGYGTDVVGVDFALQQGVNFLQKPYNPGDLANTVRACLDSAFDLPKGDA